MKGRTESKNQMTGYGFTDQAAQKDLFQISDYIGGLARFIERCNTPMTISIQGTWGTGKTSIMNLIKNELEDQEEVRIKPIWFNTWQYSQFNMENELAVSLITNLIREFELKQTDEEKKQTNKLMTGLKFALNLGKDLTLGYLEATFGSRIADKAKEAGEQAKQKAEGNAETMPDPTLAISQLKDEFAACVAKAKEQKNVDRIVIFIDDLDRLSPRRAVELLEVLKIFLDCQDCVFVLAIDYDVVTRGVAEKYGTLSGDPEEDREKGKSFFDKIIQVPFRMPVARYQIDNYVKTCFEMIRIPVDEDELSTYVDLIKYSIGTNPRAMKRLFNTYQLLSLVVPEDIMKDDRNRQLLFATLCLQDCNENLYSFIIRNRQNLTSELLQAIVNCDLKVIRSVDDVDDLTEDDLASAKPFMEKFYNAIDLNDSDELDENEVDNLINVLQFSTITDTGKVDDSVMRKGLRTTTHLAEDVYGLKYAYLQNKPEDLQKIIDCMKNVFGDEAYILMKQIKSGIDIAMKFHDEKFKVYTLGISERKNGFAVFLNQPFGTVGDAMETYRAINPKIKLSHYGESLDYTFMTVHNHNDEELDMLKRVMEEYNRRRKA